jgi:hypothetical protein
MQPTEIANSYDAIAHQWLEPFLDNNGIHQHAPCTSPYCSPSLDM